jgi:hypothetical protein
MLWIKNYSKFGIRWHFPFKIPNFLLNFRTENFKLVTDEQVFFDKFLCNKFYFPSVRVYIQQVLYEKFSHDKFYLLVWTCQKKVFIVAMAEKI